MADALKKKLSRISGKKDDAFSVDELQGLLLQVSFAVMMVFVIAYFMFRNESRQKEEEQIIELQRQKLVNAVDDVNANYRIRYGLNILMPNRAGETFNPSDVISGGNLTDVPVIRKAFTDGAVYGESDFSEPLKLRRAWMADVTERAGLSTEEISSGNAEWLGNEADASIEKLGADLRTISYACASELQKYWMKNQKAISDPAVADILKKFNESSEEARLLLVTDLSDALRKYSFSILSKAAGHDVLQ